MQTVLLLGSNSIDKFHMLEQAVRQLAQIGTLTACSSLYETAPWGFECNENFLNQAVILESEESAADILTQCLHIEKMLGRIRLSDAPRYTSRPIDIDIIFYGTDIIETPQLTVPHPRMQQRNFVLTPLTEIMPDFVHPTLHKTIATLLAECPDTLEVKRISSELQI